MLLSRSCFISLELLQLLIRRIFQHPFSIWCYRSKSLIYMELCELN
jgi:hypothetical protein